MPLQNCYNTTILHEAGCDEAGRGCLAGSVFAAAVVLPPNFCNPLLTDSKQLTEKQRYHLRPIIIQQATAWAVAQATAAEIDTVNILNASILAMHRALYQILQQIPLQHIAVDGNKFKPFENIQHQCIVKGDTLYANIAAASVLAKTFRDDYMQQLHTQYPNYSWEKNKGYPTAEHRKNIHRYGLSPYHRKTFNGCQLTE